MTGSPLHSSKEDSPLHSSKEDSLSTQAKKTLPSTHSSAEGVHKPGSKKSPTQPKCRERSYKPLHATAGLLHPTPSTRQPRGRHPLPHRCSSRKVPGQTADAQASPRLPQGSAAKPRSAVIHTTAGTAVLNTPP